MKKYYRVLPFCTKHKIHHGQKFPSCMLKKKDIPGGSFSINLPSGTRVDFVWKGNNFSARDIATVYKLLKIQHYYA